MRAIRPATILAVDDNEVQLYALTRILNNAGFQVQEAANGARTLELAESQPDLIILDVNLPDIDGFEVCKRLKANPKTKDIPIIFLSASHGPAGGTERARYYGAQEFLTSPIMPTQLTTIVNGVLVRRSREKSLT